MENLEIRRKAKENNVRMWEIAEKYGISAERFSVKLRRELPEKEQKRIIDIINDISREKISADV